MIIFNKMENILKRISLLAHNEEIKIGALEKKIGASKGVLSRALNNNTDIQAKWLQKIIENFPQYNSEWLLTGNGDMKKNMLQANDEVVEMIDRQSIDFIMGRYETLAVENAHLKKELKHIKTKLYQNNGDDLQNLVAEPEN